MMEEIIDEIKSKALDLEITRHQKIMSGGYLKGSEQDFQIYGTGSDELAKFTCEKMFPACIRSPYLRHLKTEDISKVIFSGSLCCSAAVLIVKVWRLGKNKGFCLVADAINKGIVDKTYYGSNAGPCSVCEFCSKDFHTVDFLYDLFKTKVWSDGRHK
jgi:hypothetical protein